VKGGELKKAKARIRREVLAARDALTPDERSALGARVVDRFLGLPEVREARTVLVFWSFGSEVPTAALIERLHAAGVRVALPRIEERRLVPVTYAPGDPTTGTSFGAEEPAAGSRLPPAALDVVAVPGVAFDRRGGRIGYGGGYYDGFLRDIRSLTVGLAFSIQLLDEDLPTGAFDRRVDRVVTDAATIGTST
jgi:5-formyltetrahydrofolate cyclo-ligase